MGKVTINDICKAARVSLTTVSRVLNDQPGVGDETRKRVQAVMKRLHYTPNAAARHLSRRMTETLGVVFPKFDTGFFSQFLRGVEAIARPEGFYLLTVTAADSIDPLEICHKLIDEQRVDGLLLFDPTLSAKDAGELRKRELPMVIADRRAKNLKLPSVAIDDFRGGYEATRHLVEHGYQSIALLSGPLDWEDARERKRGFEAALRESGMEPNPSMMVEGNFEREPSTAQFIRHFRDHPWPEAVFASNDEMALGLLKHVSNHADDRVRATAIAGFDDITLASYVGLTTVHVPIDQMGRKSAALLVDLIRSKGEGAAAIPQEIIPTKMQIRSSCGCFSSQNKPQPGRLLQA